MQPQKSREMHEEIMPGISLIKYSIMFLDYCICQLFEIRNLSWFILFFNKYTLLYLIVIHNFVFFFLERGLQIANCIYLRTHAIWICPILRYSFFGLNLNLVAGWDIGNPYTNSDLLLFMTHPYNFDLCISFDTDGILLRHVEVHMVSLVFSVWRSSVLCFP